MTQEEFNAMLRVALAQGLPGGYYTSKYTGEKTDELLQRVDEGEIIIPSSTAGSTKKFKLTVDDTGTVSATEVTT